MPEEGNLVRWPWFQFYDSAPSLQQSDEIVQSWDTASKTSDLADYSVCTTWHIKGGQYYLLEVFREKLAFPDLQRAVIAQAKKFNARTVLIEDSASGTALIQNLRGQHIAGLCSPIAVKPEDDKVMRIHRQSAKIEAGSVHLPKKASWLDDFRQELLAFPYGAHDDQVDSMSQFLNWIDWRERRKIHVRKLIGF